MSESSLSFVVGPRHWKHVLVKVVGASILWILMPLLLPLRRWTGLLLGALGALLVQPAAFWLWHRKLGAIWWTLMQFASVRFLIGFGSAALVVVHPSPSGEARWSISADETDHHEIEN